MDSSTKLSMFNINSGGYLLFPIYTKYKDLELEHLIINAGNGDEKNDWWYAKSNDNR